MGVIKLADAAMAIAIMKAFLYKAHLQPLFAFKINHHAAKNANQQNPKHWV